MMSGCWGAADAAVPHYIIPNEIIAMLLHLHTTLHRLLYIYYIRIHTTAANYDKNGERLFKIYNFTNRIQIKSK